MITLKLKKIVAINEMTQAELVEKTGIRQPTISAIYNNKCKHLPISVIDKICTVLNCQPSDWIIYTSDDSNKEKSHSLPEE